MNYDFDANDTMRLVANLPLVDIDGTDGDAVIELLDGMGLPSTDDNMLLALFGIKIGRFLGKREERARRNNGKENNN